MKKRLTIAGTLLLFFLDIWLTSFPASAQVDSALTEIDAVKFTKGSIQDSNAFMAFGLTLDDGITYVSSAGSDDNVVIRAEIHPVPEHVGQPSDLFMVLRPQDNSWLMKDEDGNWLTWSVKISELVPFRSDVTLTSVVEATFLSGMLSQYAGKLRLFIAYSDPDGALQLNPVPFKVTITSPGNNEEQAFSLFEDNILPNIIYGSCITCHNDGSLDNGNQFNAPYQYVLPNVDDYVNINFGIIKTLLNSRSREFILDKASGRILHFGGAQLPASSQQYMDFDTFLTLLEQ